MTLPDVAAALAEAACAIGAARTLDETLDTRCSTSFKRAVRRVDHPPAGHGRPPRLAGDALAALPA